MVSIPVPPRMHVTPVTFTAPARVIEDVTPAPGVLCATPAPETDYVTQSPVM